MRKTALILCIISALLLVACSSSVKTKEASTEVRSSSIENAALRKIVIAHVKEANDCTEIVERKDDVIGYVDSFNVENANYRGAIFEDDILFVTQVAKTITESMLVNGEVDSLIWDGVKGTICNMSLSLKSALADDGYGNIRVSIVEMSDDQEPKGLFVVLDGDLIYEVPIQ